MKRFNWLLGLCLLGSIGTAGATTLGTYTVPAGGLAAGTEIIFAQATPGGTSTPTPTPTATPTPSGVLPNGVPNPSSGSWVLQVDDEFTTDNNVNHNFWNGGPGAPSGVNNGYFPLCDPSGNTFGYYLTDEDDYLGYGGLDSNGQECGQIYTAQNGAGNTVSSLGLAVQDYNTLPGTAYNSNEWAGLQNYGIFSIKAGSFIEWKAKLPHDTSGEGDGLHYDLWCTTNNRTQQSNQSPAGELDIAENVTGTASYNHEVTTSSIFDNTDAPEEGFTYGADSTDLTATENTYGVYWSPSSGGSNQGYFQIYLNGVAQYPSAVAVSASGWGDGMYCFAGWMQEVYSGTLGNGQQATWKGVDGNFADSSTTNNDPLLVQYWRYWTQN